MADEPVVEPGTEGPKESQPEERQPNSEEVLEAVRYVHNQNLKLQTELEQLRQGGAPAPAAPVAAPTEPPKSVDLEDMDRGQFANHIVSTVVEQLRPLAQQLEETKRESTRTGLEGQLTDLRKSNPEVTEYMREMKEVYEQHPDMKMSEALMLAKARNPAKVQAAEDRARVALDKKKEEEGEPEQTFAGFLPTSGVTKKNSRMPFEDAFNSAWDNTMGNSGIH